MDFKKHLETAWNKTLQNIVILILMTLIMMVVSILTIGILAPVVMAGYIQAVVQLMRNGREPRIDDLFSQMKLFLPLLGFFIVVIVAASLGFFLFVLPGLAVLLAVVFGCLYMIPLMTDKKMGLVQAFKGSWEIALSGNVADHIVVVILYIGLMSIGSSVFIGTLLTMPFATVFLISIYLERIAADTSTVSQTPSSPTNSESA